MYLRLIVKSISLIGVEIALVLLCSDVFPDNRLITKEKISLLAFDTLVLVLGLILINLINRSNVEKFKNLFLNFLIFAVLFFWISSWCSFYATGGFLDLESIKFVLPNPIQVIHWVPTYLLYCVPLGVVILYFIISKFNKVEKNLLKYYFGIFLVLLVVWFYGLPREYRYKKLVSDTKDMNPYYEGVKISINDLYYNYLRSGTGPFSSIIGEAIFPNPISFKSDPEIKVVKPNRISSEEYRNDFVNKEFKKFNVIAVIIESLRSDRINLSIQEKDVMPNLKKLGNESLVFKNCYSQATHSNYADVPPIASQYPLRSHSTHVYPEEPLYPRTPIYDLLKQFGWRTAIISSQNDHWGKVINYFNTGTLDLYLNPENMGAESSVAETDIGFANWVTKTKHAGSVDDKVTIDKALEWVSSSDQPFFLYLNLQSTHFPYVVPKNFKRQFGPEKIDFVMNFNSYPKDKIEVVEALYNDSAYYVDQQLNRLLEKLKDLGKFDSTIIVVTGDHGQAFYEHGFASHANLLYDEVLKVPLIIKVPGLPSQTFDQIVEHVDIPPTILEVLGLPIFSGFQGSSVLSKDNDQRAYFVSQTPLAHQYGAANPNGFVVYDYKKNVYHGFDMLNDKAQLNKLSLNGNDNFAKMKKYFDTFINEQISYYSNKDRMRKEFPPVISD